MTVARPEFPQKAVVRRLVDEVMNEHRLEVLDELCTPAMARRWRRFEKIDEVYFFGFENGRIATAWGLEDTLERLRQLDLGATT
jgi:hypothetical protein